MRFGNLMLWFSFIMLITIIDQWVAVLRKRRKCQYCGGRLWWSRWNRVGFGLPHALWELSNKHEALAFLFNQARLRRSMICSRCGRRNTPDSLLWTYYQRVWTPLIVYVGLCVDAGKYEEVKKITKFVGMPAKSLLAAVALWIVRIRESALGQIHAEVTLPLLLPLHGGFCNFVRRVTDRFLPDFKGFRLLLLLRFSANYRTENCFKRDPLWWTLEHWAVFNYLLELGKKLGWYKAKIVVHQKPVLLE